MNSIYEIINGDSKDILRIWKDNKFPDVDYLITSPPYWDMLRKGRGNCESTHTERRKKGMDLYYSDNPEDLGNVEDYDKFLEQLKLLFFDIYKILKPGAYMTIVIQNVRIAEGYVRPLAWDLAVVLSSKYRLLGELLWLQDDTFLGIWGYPHSFTSNTCHHYCLNFQKPGERSRSINKYNKDDRYEIIGDRGKYDKTNSLNNLTGKEWLKFTKSWKIYRPKNRDKTKETHPASYPEELVHDFVSFFTKKNDLVLDPFLGSGTTIRVSRKIKRNCIGIEINPVYIEMAKNFIEEEDNIQKIEENQVKMF